MAGEGARILVRLLAFDRHVRCFNDQRFARAHVAGFAAVHDVGIGDVDLLNFRIVVSGLFAAVRQSGSAPAAPCCWRGIRKLFPGVTDRLENVAQLRAKLRAICFKIVVSFFQPGEVVIFLAPIRILHREWAFFVVRLNLSFYFPCRICCRRSEFCRSAH